MPIVVPPFAQYQQPLTPLKGNWRRQARNPDNSPQDDAFVSCEIDWLVSPPTRNAVQISLAGGSVQPIAQIAALVVDNSRCGSDIQFIFPDTGFVIDVAARTPGGIYPVLTNALNFYVVAPNALNTDITVFQVCNSVPPPLALLPSAAQQLVAISATGTGLAAVVPAGINGTLLGFDVTVAALNGAAQSQITFLLNDGNVPVKNLWQTTILQVASTTQNYRWNSTGLSLRFFNGINLTFATIVGGFTTLLTTATVYYSTP